MIALGGLARDEPIGDIERNLLGIARGGIAEAAAARRLEPDKITARHALPALGTDQFAGDEADAAGRAGAAAVAAARRVGDALEIAQHRDRRTVGAPQLNHLAEPAAVLAGTARPLAVLAAAEQHGRHRLGRLDRDRAHPARERGHVKSVLPRPRAGAAAMEDRGAERPDLGPRMAVCGAELVEHVGPAINLRDP